MSRIVITGGPGVGKTTLLLALQARGYTIVGDSARAIIQDRLRRGLSPRPNAYEFVHETLRMDIANFVHHAATPGHVFFDRSVLDALCGLDRVTPLNESELSRWLSEYQYCSKVFLLPPWKAIYVNDTERDHTFEHAESVNRITQEWYRRCRYQLIGYPRFQLQSGVRTCCKRWQTATPNKAGSPYKRGRHNSQVSDVARCH
jgi:predicted ATPase